MNKEQITKLQNVIKTINAKIVEARRKYTFWCPKDMDSEHKKQGYTLYAYGGRVLDLYLLNGVMRYSVWDKDYKSYSEEIDKIREILINKSGTADKKIARLTSISTEDWEKVLTAFKTWAEYIDNNKKTTHFERMRETAIANKNQVFKNGNIKIIEMESRNAIGKKPDLIGVRREKDNIILSYIEYKCTTAAMTGTQSPVEHYKDMRKHYKDRTPAIFESYFERSCWENNDKAKPDDAFDLKNATKEIVFLFSHITDENNESNKSQELTVQDVLTGIKAIKTEMGRSNDDVKIMFIKDECERLKTDNKHMMTVQDAIKWLEAKKVR